MISLLLVLTAGPAIPQDRATLQSCEMTPTGWVCHYQMPSVTVQGVASGTVVLSRPPAAPPPSPVPEISTAEADRRARLIARCADASWLSLCLPGDRREARVLQEAATARAALRGEVTRLLSENRCDDAVRAALSGSDLGLATEARAFCRPVAAPDTVAREIAGNGPPASS